MFWILWGLDTLCHAGQEWSTFTLWTRQNEKGKGACCVFGGLLCIARLLYQVEGRFKGAAVCRGFSRLCCTLRQVPISQVQGTKLTLACDKHGLHLILLDTWACPSTSTQAISVCGFVGSLHFRSYSGNLAFAHTSAAFADLRHWTNLHTRNLILILKSEVMRIGVPIAISTAIYDCLGAWPSVKSHWAQVPAKQQDALSGESEAWFSSRATLAVCGHNISLRGSCFLFRGHFRHSASWPRGMWERLRLTLRYIKDINSEPLCVCVCEIVPVFGMFVLT